MNPIEHLPVSHFFCPIKRFWSSKILFCKTIDDDCIIIHDSGFFSYLKENNTSYAGHQLYPLFWCNNKEYYDDEFMCGACRCKSIGTTYYFCIECEFSYHKECVESLPLIKSLYHRHNLQLLLAPRFHKFAYYTTLGGHYKKDKACSHCGSDTLSIFYHCSLCSFSIDPVCARKPPFLTYKKRHEHTLTYFPRKTNLICDVCGLPDDNKSLIYVCLQCDFVVHKLCVYLPFVIRISRHEHRVSFTYSSPSAELSCGVCRQNVDENCGKYSCMKDCTYVVHSKCATREDVWDGKELEDEPEEVYEHLNSFEVIGDGVIQHFSHPHHHLRFENGDDMPYDEKKKCEACVLPLYEGDVYNCVDLTCDFLLHEACANLPRTKQHMAFPGPFTLRINGNANYFRCKLCDRYSCGFKYESSKGGEFVTLDVRCAAISEPFHHECHPMHYLFLTTTARVYKTCSVCREERRHHLNCLECDFVLCFGCATLPYKVRYEHDEHILTLSYEENASLNWCDACEEPIESTKWLYTCNECGVALHIYCFRGQNGDYMKPAQNSIFSKGKINVVPNYGLTRLICYRCRTLCQDKIIFETRAGDIVCSYSHLYDHDFRKS